MLLDETNSEMRAETKGYINQLNKQINNDFKLLYTIGSMLETTGGDSSENLAEILEKANRQNDFVSMMYFDIRGEGVAVSIVDSFSERCQLQDIQQEVQDVIWDALGGKYGLSQPFGSEFTGRVEFAYAVPVKRNGRIIGALAGMNTVRVFSEILDVNGILGGNGYVHLLDSDGNYLIYSKQSVVSEAHTTIFDGPYFRKDEIADVKEHLRNDEEVVFSFDYGKNTYRCLIEPAEFNGWHMLCVNTYQNNQNALYKLVMIILIAFTIVLGMIIVMGSYVYKTLTKNFGELIYVAYWDSLCGIYNRSGFFHGVETAMAKSRRFSIAAVNVYQFMFVNEVFGQDKGDELLKFIAKNIQECLVEDEFVCRDTGDMFYVFLRDTDRKILFERLTKLIEKIEGSSMVEKSSYRLRMYCGCVTADGESQVDINNVMSQLIFTTTKAKDPRSARICFYEGNLEEKMQMENYVEGHMQEALENEEFKMFLQPQFDLQDKRLLGAEALVRWITDNGRYIFPDQFIPIFEQNGFCVNLDMYMIECACRQIRDWMNRGIEPINISVNQTKLLFYDAHYVEKLTSMLQKYDVPANLITLEILESFVVDSMEVLNRRIEELRSCGFRISMDDFGSGYSSLNVLAKLNIDELKVDRTFLKQMDSCQEQRTEVVLQQIIHMTKALHIATVVEGVETEEQEDLVVNMGCNLAQGYYYSRPIPKDEFNHKYMGYKK